MNTVTKKENGFTIIEVVLVLAIAALIMLMVFLAWPALQRNQRDQAKKNDISLVGSAIGTWKSNHQGQWPTNFTDLQVKLSQYEDTSINWLVTSDIFDENQMTVRKGMKCNADLNGTTGGGSGRGGAILVVLEANGTPQRFCQDI